MSRKDAGRTNAFPPWLYESQIDGEGSPALYPYAQLRNILAPEDVRAVISDECGPIEAEFGVHAVEPFHRLLWLLNTTQAFFTTHVNIAPRDFKPPFDWARTQVAAQIIMLSRNPAAHDHRAPAEALAGWLAKLLTSAPHVTDSSGWMISVGPTPMTLIRLRTPDAHYPYRDEDLVESTGFGIVLRIRGCANSRVQAAQRWGGAVNTVVRVIEQEQNLGNIGRVSPHQHVEHAD
jgi:hypothetical protein